MLQLLALVIPLGLAGAISPMLFTEQTVILAGRNGSRNARLFTLAAMGTLLVLISALVLFGQSISLPKTPHLDARLDVVVGALLIALAVFLHFKKSAAPKAKPQHGELDPRAALTLGVISMTTNFTTLALMVPAAKGIAASHVDAVERFAAVLVLVVLAAIPAWLPLALTAIAPGPASRALGAFGDFIKRSGHLATVILLALVGLFFLARGIVRLAT